MVLCIYIYIYRGSRFDGIPRKQYSGHLKKDALEFSGMFEWDGFYCMIPSKTSLSHIDGTLRWHTEKVVFRPS